MSEGAIKRLKAEGDAAARSCFVIDEAGAVLAGRGSDETRQLVEERPRYQVNHVGS